MAGLVFLGVAFLSCIFTIIFAVLRKETVKVNFGLGEVKLGGKSFRFADIVQVEAVRIHPSGGPDLSVKFILTANTGDFGVVSVYKTGRLQEFVNMIQRFVSVPASGVGFPDLVDSPERQVVSREVAVSLVNYVLARIVNKSTVTPE